MSEKGRWVLGLLPTSLLTLSDHHRMVRCGHNEDKLGMEAHAYGPGSPETTAGGSAVQGWEATD